MGLMAGGDQPATWAWQTACLATLAALACVTAPSSTFGRALRGHHVSLSAYIVLIVWAWATTVPLPEWAHEFAHPMTVGAVGSGDATISIAPTATWIGLVKLGGIAAAFALGALAGAEPRVRSLAVRALLICSAGFGVLCLAGFATGAVRRLDGGLPSPNVTAAVFACVALLASAALIRAARLRKVELPRALTALGGVIAAPMSAATALIAIVCLMLTGSRGGVVLTVVAAVILAIALRRSSGSRRMTPPAGVIGFVIAVSALALMALAPVMDRLADGVDAVLGRQTLIETHWRAFLDRPILGHGLGAYAQINSQLVTLENSGALLQAGAAHNVVVQTLEEVGVVGLALWIVVLGPMIAQALWPRGAAQPEWRAAILAIGVLLFSHASIDITLQVQALSVFFAFLLGLLTPGPDAEA